MSSERLSIGILFPGEMGSSLGALLSAAGVEVLTTTEGRSKRTAALAEASGITIAGSVTDVLDRSDAIVSLVTPDAASHVAHQVASLWRRSSRELTYIDANSISPMTAREIAQTVSSAGMTFLDASIFGLASRLRDRGVLCLSGTKATDFAKLFEPAIRVQVVGAEPGKASALKMIVSAVPKGIAALLVETMSLAREMELLPEATETWDELYPGIMELLRRLLPTYPQHAARRAQELREVEHTMLANNIAPRVVSAARRITELQAGHFDSLQTRAHWEVEDIIEELHRAHALVAETDHAIAS